MPRPQQASITPPFCETRGRIITLECTKMQIASRSDRGSILVWTVLIIGILSLLAAEVLRVVSAKYENALQTATWQEALLAAESGIDLAIVELRKSLYPAPNHAWEGWHNAPVNG